MEAIHLAAYQRGQRTATGPLETAGPSAAAPSLLRQKQRPTEQGHVLRLPASNAVVEASHLQEAQGAPTAVARSST